MSAITASTSHEEKPERIPLEQQQQQAAQLRIQEAALPEKQIQIKQEIIEEEEEPVIVQNGIPGNVVKIEPIEREQGHLPNRPLRVKPQRNVDRTPNEELNRCYPIPEKYWKNPNHYFLKSEKRINRENEVKERERERERETLERRLRLKSVRRAKAALLGKGITTRRQARNVNSENEQVQKYVPIAPQEQLESNNVNRGRGRGSVAQLQSKRVATSPRQSDGENLNQEQMQEESNTSHAQFEATQQERVRAEERAREFNTHEKEESIQPTTSQSQFQLTTESMDDEPQTQSSEEIVQSAPVNIVNRGRGQTPKTQIQLKRIAMNSSDLEGTSERKKARNSNNDAPTQEHWQEGSAALNAQFDSTLAERFWDFICAEERARESNTQIQETESIQPTTSQSQFQLTTEPMGDEPQTQSTGEIPTESEQGLVCAEETAGNFSSEAQTDALQPSTSQSYHDIMEEELQENRPAEISISESMREDLQEDVILEQPNELIENQGTAPLNHATQDRAQIERAVEQPVDEPIHNQVREHLAEDQEPTHNALDQTSLQTQRELSESMVGQNNVEDVEGEIANASQKPQKASRKQVCVQQQDPNRNAYGLGIARIEMEQANHEVGRCEEILLKFSDIELARLKKEKNRKEIAKFLKNRRKAEKDHGASLVAQRQARIELIFQEGGIAGLRF